MGSHTRERDVWRAQWRRRQEAHLWLHTPLLPSPWVNVSVANVPVSYSGRDACVFMTWPLRPFIDLLCPLFSSTVVGERGAVYFHCWRLYHDQVVCYIQFCFV